MQKEKNLYTTPSIRLTCSIQQKVCIKRAGNIYKSISEQKKKKKKQQNRQAECKYSIQYFSISVFQSTQSKNQP